MTQPDTSISNRRRHFRAYLQAPRGSKWYRGNFTLGVMIDSHPMFFNFIIGFGLFDVVLCWEYKS